MADSPSLTDASTELTSAPQEMRLSPMEDSYGEVVAPPSISPIRAPKMPMRSPSPASARAAQAHTSSRDPLQDVDGDSAHTSRSQSSLPSLSSSSGPASSRATPSSRPSKSRARGDGGPGGAACFVQLPLRRYQADLDEAQRYTHFYEDGRRRAAKQALAKAAATGDESASTAAADHTAHSGAASVRSSLSSSAFSAPRQQRSPRASASVRRPSAKQQPNNSSAREDGGNDVWRRLSQSGTATTPRATPGRADRSQSSAAPQQASRPRSLGSSPARSAARSPRTEHDGAGAGRGSRRAAGPAAATTPGTDPFTRLYSEAGDRRQRSARRQSSQQRAEERAARASCSFHPDREPWRAVDCAVAGAWRGSSGGSSGSSADRDGAGTAHSQPTSPPRAHQRHSRRRSPQTPTDFNDFLAAQRTREERRQEKLAAASEKLRARQSPELLSSVPHSAVRDSLSAYLVKEKGYTGPITGWTDRFRAYMARSQPARTPRGRSAGSSRASRSPTNGRSLPRSPRSARSGAASATSSQGSAQPARESVFDRLYSESSVRDTTRRVLALLEEEHEAHELFRPNARRAVPRGRASDSTRQASGDSSNPAADGEPSPGAASADDRASASAGRRRRSPRGPRASVFDALFAEQQAREERRRELALGELEEQDAECTFAPVVTRRSRQLILERAQAVARGEPRAARRQPSDTGAAEEPDGGGGKDTTSRHASRGADSRRPSPSATDKAGQPHLSPREFSNRVALFEAKKREKLLAKRAAEGQQELRDCTFRPRLSLVTRSIATASAGDGRPTPHRSAWAAVPVQSITDRPRTTLDSRGGESSFMDRRSSASERRGSSGSVTSPRAPRSYAQAMETPEVKRSLWSEHKRQQRSETRLSATPRSPRTAAAAAVQRAAPKEGGEGPVRAPPLMMLAGSSVGGPRGGSPTSRRPGSTTSSAFSTPVRVAAGDATPAGPRPLRQLLHGSTLNGLNRSGNASAGGPVSEGRARGRPSSALAAGERVPLSISRQEERTGAHPYFCAGAAYCEDDDAGEAEETGARMRNAVSRAMDSSCGEPNGAHPAGFSTLNSDARERETRTHDSSLSVDAQPPPILRDAAVTSPNASAARVRKSVSFEGRVEATDEAPRDQRLAATDRPRPPIAPPGARRIHYGLGHVTGSSSATSVELQALEKELCGVLSGWAARLDDI